MFKKLAKVSAATAVGGSLFTFYHYPELRSDPVQLLDAFKRGIRCITTCTLMASDYVMAGDNITSQTHYKAAGRMYKCFCANGGPYIKLG